MNIENSIYKTNKYKYNFRRFETIRSFGRDKADIDQSNLLMEIMDFRKKSKTKKSGEKQQKINTLESLHETFEDRERVIDIFKN